MKVIEQNKSVFSGATRSVKQSISEEHIARAAYLVRDQLYSDKRKATFCETLLNAVDEHRKYNIDRPVEVILTKDILIIRDFAKGLSPDKVEQVFFQFFESTKSDNNEAIGGFGIGAKAPGSYSDIYYVDSYHNGKKYCYVSTVNGYEASASLLFEEECDIDNTGICVRIPIKKDTVDYIAFHSIIYDMIHQVGFYIDKQEILYYKAFDKNISVFSYEDWLNANASNLMLAPFPYKKLRKAPNYISVDGQCLVIHRYGGDPIEMKSSFFTSSKVWAYDGDMFYKINLSREQLDIFGSLYGSYAVVLFFKRGELSILPSREGVAMTAATNAWWESKIVAIKKAINDQYKAELSKALEKYVPVEHAISCTKNVFGPLYKLIDIPYTDFNFVTSEFVDSAIKITNGRVMPNSGSIIRPISGMRHLFLVYDIETRTSKPRLVEALKTRLRQFISSNDYWNIYDSNYTPIYLVDNSRLDKFNKILSEFPYYRKDKDYFMVSDLIDLLPEPEKRQSVPKIVIPNDIFTRRPVPDITKTLIVTKTEIENNEFLSYIVKYYSDYYRSTVKILKFFGVNNIARCNARDKARFIKDGAKSFEELDMNKILQYSVDQARVVFCPDWIREFASKTCQFEINVLKNYDSTKISKQFYICDRYNPYIYDTTEILTDREFAIILANTPSFQEKVINPAKDKAEKMFIDKINSLDTNTTEQLYKFAYHLSNEWRAIIPAKFGKLTAIQEKNKKEFELIQQKIHTILRDILTEIILTATK